MAPSIRREAVSPLNEVKPEICIEGQGASDGNTHSPTNDEYTTLRRSTRSSTGAIPETSTSSSNLNLSRYAYNPVTPPRKRVKLQSKHDGDKLDTKLLIQTPITKIKDEPDTGDSVPRPAPTPRSSSKKMPQLALDKPHKEPDRWKEQYRLIEYMRKGIVAPVDNMQVLFHLTMAVSGLNRVGDVNVLELPQTPTRR